MSTTLKTGMGFLLILLMSSLQAQKIHQELIIDGPTERQGGDLRFKPNPEDMVHNVFSTSNEVIKLAIPITNRNLRIETSRVYNISKYKFFDRKVNALMVVLDGNNGQRTKETPIIGYLKATIPFDAIKNEGKRKKNNFMSRLKRHKKLVVWVVHDDIIGQNSQAGKCLLDETINYFRKRARSYSFRIPSKITYECDSIDYSHIGISLEDLFIPREQDGDIIGGN